MFLFVLTQIDVDDVAMSKSVDLFYLRGLNAWSITFILILVELEDLEDSSKFLPYQLLYSLIAMNRGKSLFPCYVGHTRDFFIHS